MLARISQLQRQLKVLAAENDSLRAQGSFSFASSAGGQARIRNLQGQVQSLGQQLDVERRVRSHLYDMQVGAERTTPPQRPTTQQQTQPPPRAPQQQQQPAYGAAAKAPAHGPLRPAPATDFRVTVEAVVAPQQAAPVAAAVGRAGRVASAGASSAGSRGGGPSSAAISVAGQFR
ncbi:hypothetical protein PLESTF_001210500 [Pleodorina starrii]|nr:hypothetical protein PLESTF_001210500 [Pleodorina starrii]